MSKIFEEQIALKFQLYNSLFLNLPFGHIAQTGSYLPLFAKSCQDGFEKGLSPATIVDHFFRDYFPSSSDQDRNDILFNFIQFIERQVVLFDAVEDAAFKDVHDLTGAGTIDGLFTRAKIQNRLPRLVEKVDDLTLRIVLTAHPTQFYPGSVLGIINDLSSAINDDKVQEVDILLRQLGKTPFLKRSKPTPYDEAKSLIWFLENVFYESISNVVFKIENQLRSIGKTLDKEDIIQMGFWPGGDRDGNPFVTTDTTRRVADRLRRTIQILYFRDIRVIQRRLTFPGVSELVEIIEKKLYNGINQNEDAYQNAEEILLDLRTLRDLLMENHQSMFVDEVLKMITKVKIFGLHLAIVDIRQDSSELESMFDIFIESWNDDVQQKWKEGSAQDKVAILENLHYRDLSQNFMTETQKDTFDSFALMEEIQTKNGLTSCHRYIISNCQGYVHILQAFHMARLCRTNMNVDIVPLFETIDDLKNAGDQMRLLYTNPQYKKHLESRSHKQTVMLGFSDGTKDGGYLSANWSIFQAKENLTAVSREYGIDVAFFDGRGGPPARGGGSTHQFYASLGSTIEDKQIQITIQGQTISSNFGTTDSASFNMEQLFSAGLENHVFSGDQKNISKKQRNTLNALSETSLEAYLNFKQHPKFLDYLEEMGTLPYYGETNIGSRPVKRAGGGKLTLKKLRAIPFVGSWSQMKQNVPGYFGLGRAIQEFENNGNLQDVKDLYQGSAFFRALVQNSMQSLNKCYFPLTSYLSDHKEYGEIWNIIHDEYLQTKRLLLEITGEKQLLETVPNTRKSIALREQLVLPLLTIQQYGLSRTRIATEEEAKVFHKMVLRTMFGIINAGRNSA